MVDLEKVRLNMKISALEEQIEEKNKRIDRLSGERDCISALLDAQKTLQNKKAIEELTKLFDKVQEVCHTNEMDKAWLIDYIESAVFKLTQEEANDRNKESR